MKASEIPALREKLTKACDEKIAQGWEIVSGTRIFSYTATIGGKEVMRVYKCDPLGAATEESDMVKIAKALKIRKADATRFAVGFAGFGIRNGYGLRGTLPRSRAGQLGLELRQKYIPAEDKIR